MFFFQTDPRPHGMPKQVFLACFELMVARFGPPKIPKCLENGLFCHQKSLKNRSKMYFSKDTFGLFGVHKQVEWAHFEPMLSNIGPSQCRKGLEYGPIWDHKWLKNGWGFRGPFGGGS